jgi:hypothetical protein
MKRLDEIVSHSVGRVSLAKVLTPGAGTSHTKVDTQVAQ